MKLSTTTALAIVTLLMAPSLTLAQNLTKAQEGRVEVGKCYRQCSFQGYASGQFLLGLEAQFGPNYTAHEAVVGCIAAQEHVRNM